MCVVLALFFDRVNSDVSTNARYEFRLSFGLCDRPDDGISKQLRNIFKRNNPEDLI